jgi:hypothetical protein
VNKRHAQPVLERADLVADGGRRHVHFTRGFLEAEQAASNVKRAQGGERGQVLGH